MWMIAAVELLKVWVLKNIFKPKLMTVWIRKLESNCSVLLEVVPL